METHGSQPAAGFAKIQSLAQLEHDFLIYRNEAPYDQDVKEFWDLIAARGLPFRRRNILGEILKRGRIKTDIEYEYLQDMIPAQRQLGNITESEEDKIGRMLEEYGSA